MQEFFVYNLLLLLYSTVIKECLIRNLKMKELKAARFDLVKENNVRLIRNLLRERVSLSKAEIAQITSLSFPTVTSVVRELLLRNEIREVKVASSGGRPSVYLGINPDYKVILCISNIEGIMYSKVYDYCGNLMEEREEKYDAFFDKVELLRLLIQIKKRYPKLTDVFWSIPGVALDGVIYHYPDLPKLEHVDVAEYVKKHLEIQLFIENDVNTIAMTEVNQWESFAHILWIDECIGSAVILNGKVIRGAHGCAGEVEYVCAEPEHKMQCLIQAVKAITAVLDLRTIVLSGPEVSRAEVLLLQEEVNQVFARFRCPNLVYADYSVEMQFEGLWKMAEEYLGRII